MLPQSDDRLDRELAAWFSVRKGGWSGTAAVLLASLRTVADADGTWSPYSSRMLYAHLESHQHILRSLGMEVVLHHGFPRMVSLRSCETGQTPNSPSDVERMPGASLTATSLVEGQNSSSADSSESSIPGDEFHADIPLDQSECNGRSGRGKYSNSDMFGGRVFGNTGQALFAIVEMRRRIRERNLDLESAVDLVIGPAQEITRCSGIAVGFLPRKRAGHPVRTTGYGSMRGQFFHANLFQSRLMAGETVLVGDAQQHPLLGAECKREGIGSLIIVPIFRHREVAGAMEFFFLEKRSLTNGDAMDLGLIAGVISESLSGATQAGVQQAEGAGRTPAAQPAKNLVEQHERRLSQEDADKDLPSLSGNGPDAGTPATRSSSSESVKMGLTASKATRTSLLWLALRRVCGRHRGS